jgi:hypothetical protein
MIWRSAPPKARLLMTKGTLILGPAHAAVKPS